MERDAEEYTAHVLTQDAALRPAYHSMHLTERSEAVTAATEPTWELQMCSAPEQAAAFMRARGLPRSVRPPHTCGFWGVCPAGSACTSPALPRILRVSKR